MYEEFEKGNSNINAIIDNLEQDEQNQITMIMSEDYEITDIEKAIDEFKKSKLNNVLLISQTTYSLEKFEKIAEKLQKEIPSIEIINTICNATKMRQEETEQMAKDVDIMIIVGGKHSSNSNKLYELAKKYCNNVLFVETASELNKKQIVAEKENRENEPSVRIGIMAGASTPKESIDKVVEKIKEM